MDGLTVLRLVAQYKGFIDSMSLARIFGTSKLFLYILVHSAYVEVKTIPLGRHVT